MIKRKLPTVKQYHQLWINENNVDELIKSRYWMMFNIEHLKNKSKRKAMEIFKVKCEYFPHLKNWRLNGLLLLHCIICSCYVNTHIWFQFSPTPFLESSENEIVVSYKTQLKLWQTLNGILLKYLNLQKTVFNLHYWKTL